MSKNVKPNTNKVQQKSKEKQKTKVPNNPLPQPKDYEEIEY
ncbi:hypothetical protein ACQKP0_14600 [Heyndrickxia sp. NPDC080065]